MSRHPNDFLIIGKNPLKPKIYPTAYSHDPEQMAQKDAFVQKRKRRYGR